MVEHVVQSHPFPTYNQPKDTCGTAGFHADPRMDGCAADYFRLGDTLMDTILIFQVLVAKGYLWGRCSRWFLWEMAK